MDQRGRLAGSASAASLGRSLDGGSVPNKLYAKYDNVFRALYNLPIQIATSGRDANMGDIIEDIFGLTTVAEYLRCVPAVTYQIDNALIRQGQVLWVAIAANPAAWAELGLRVQSELVFREAVCHLAGRWPRLLYLASRVRDSYPGGQGAFAADETYCASYGLESPRTLEASPNDGTHTQAHVSDEDATTAYDTIASLRPEVRTLVWVKHRELEECKRALNMRLMGFYPTFFARATSNNASFASGRSTIGDAIKWASQHMAGQGLPGPDPVLQGLPIGAGSHKIRNTGFSVRSTTYAKDILAWMALTLFRHWFGQYITTLSTGGSSLDGGWQFYNAIHRGGEAYLEFDSVEDFVQWFPLSARGRRDFETQIDRIKEELRSYTHAIMTSRLTLDLEKAADVVRASNKSVDVLFGPQSGVYLERRRRLRLEYLVCTQVHREELPWNRRPKVVQQPPAATERTAQLPTRCSASSGSTPRKRPRVPSPLDGSMDDNQVVKEDPSPSTAPPRAKSAHPKKRRNAINAPSNKEKEGGEGEKDEEEEEHFRKLMAAFTKEEPDPETSSVEEVDMKSEDEEEEDEKEMELVGTSPLFVPE